MHNPFAEDPELADRYLWRLGPKDRVEHVVLHQRNSWRPRWESYVSYVNVRAFEAARVEVRRRGVPDAVIFGKADRRERDDQGRAIAECLRGRTPFVLVNPISGPDCYLAVHGETLWASAAIAAASPEDTATAVASGPAVAVTSHGRGLISLGGSPGSRSPKPARTPS